MKAVAETIINTSVLVYFSSAGWEHSLEFEIIITASFNLEVTNFGAYLSISKGQLKVEKIISNHTN